MIRLLITVILIAVCSPALAKDKRGPDLPSTLPGTFKGALGQIGVVPGAVRTFPEGTFRVEALRVGREGDWLVVRIKPKRVYAVSAGDFKR